MMMNAEKARFRRLSIDPLMRALLAKQLIQYIILYQSIIIQKVRHKVNKWHPLSCNPIAFPFFFQARDSKAYGNTQIVFTTDVSTTECVFT